MQPSLLILPKELIYYIFTAVEDKDLDSFSRTCKALAEISCFSPIPVRIRDFKIISLFAGALNGKSEQLITTLNERPLSASERDALGNPAVNIDDNERKLDAVYRGGAEKCEGEFYDMFRVRCSQLGVEPENKPFILFAMTVVENLKKKPPRLGIFDESMRVKLESTKTQMHLKIVHDVVETYASQPIAMIAPANFKEKIAELEPLFPAVDKIHNESQVRNAIKSHNKRDEIALLAKELKAMPLEPFYTELDQYVYPGHEQARSDALHKIILSL